MIIRLLFKLFKTEFLKLALSEHRQKDVFEEYKSRFLPVVDPEEIFAMRKKEFLKLAFHHQSKGVDRAKLEFAFLDSEGNQYDKFTNDMDIPVLRKGQLSRMEQELYSCISDEELKDFMQVMEDALNNTDKAGHMKPNIGLIGKMITEIKQRKQLLLHPDLMFNIVACMYIRRDENPAEFDLEIQEQKVAQLKKDSTGGLYDFFYSSGIKELLPFLTITEKKLDEYLEVAQSEIKIQNKWIKSHLKKEPTLEPTS